MNSFTAADRVPAPLQRPLEGGQVGLGLVGDIADKKERVTIAALKETLRRMKAADPELGVVVKGSNEVDYQHRVSVLDVLQQLEITKVGLATDAGGSPIP